MRTFACLQCNFSSKYENSLIQHEKAVHDKTRDFQCPHCNYAASLKASLLQHIKVVHNKIKDFPCPHCNYAASQKVILRQHIKAVHDKIWDKCPHCQFSTSYKQLMTMHIRSLHKESKVLSARKSRNEDTFTEEKRRSHAEMLKHVNVIKSDVNHPFHCGLCDYSERQQSIVLEHLKAIHFKRRSKCPHCSFSTIWKPSLAGHIKNVHRNLFIQKDVTEEGHEEEFETVWLDKEEFQEEKDEVVRGDNSDGQEIDDAARKTSFCLQCNKSDKMSNLLLHIHSDGEVFKCRHCKEIQWGEYPSVLQHVKAMHYQMKENKCQLYSFSSGYDYSLKLHMTTAHAQVSMSKEEEAGRHEALASDAVRNTPRIDDENVSELATLPRHEDSTQLHFRCRQCKKRNTEENIKQHIRVTHGTKPFCCTHCKYSAEHKIFLIQHIKAIHYGVKDLKCPHCSFTTAWKTSIKNHIKSLHKHLGDHPVRSVQPEMSANSSLEETVGIENQAPFSTISWQAEDLNKASTFCSECNLSNSKKNILQHVRIVMDNGKPFHCLHCNHCTTRKHNLVKHVKLVHYKIMPKKLKCPHCSYLTDENCYLKNHIQSAHKHFTEQNIWQETSANSSFEETTGIGNEAPVFTIPWQAEDKNEASTFYKDALDIVDLTNDYEDEKKFVMLKQYRCNWCSSNSEPNNFTLEEMESHLQENHCLTLKEYLDMNEISFS